MKPHKEFIAGLNYAYNRILKLQSSMQHPEARRAHAKIMGRLHHDLEKLTDDSSEKQNA